jgi:hypothetical protein
LGQGFTIGSDAATGLAQAHAQFSDLNTYRGVLSDSYVGATYNIMYLPYYGTINTNWLVKTAPSYPTNTPTFDVVAGPGNLQYVGTDANCVSSPNVWLTNMVATLTTNGVVNLAFSIMGGTSGVPYDIYATAALQSPITNALWCWMGQGYSCNRYALTFQNSAVLLMLGTPKDSDNDGLTDAYESLMSHTSPFSADTFSTSLPDGWCVEFGLTPGPGLAGQDANQNGLSNLQEYLWGSDPTAQAPFTIWVGNPDGCSGVL